MDSFCVGQSPSKFHNIFHLKYAKTETSITVLGLKDLRLNRLWPLSLVQSRPLVGSDIGLYMGSLISGGRSSL